MTGPLRSPRGPILAGLATCALLIFGLGAWSVFAGLSGAVVAPGQIAVEDSRIAIQSPDGGVVATLTVREAEEVEAGRLLLRLDDTDLRAELQIVQTRLAEVQARSARFRAESTAAEAPDFQVDNLTAPGPEVAAQIGLQRRLFETRREAMARLTEQQRRRIAQFQAQAGGLDQRRIALVEQLALLEKEIADQAHLLDRGLTPQGRLLALKGEAAEIRGEIGAATAQIAAAGEQQAATEAELLRLAIARREEAEVALQDLGQEGRELTGRRADLLARIARLELRAPVAGMVIGLQTGHAGAVLRAAEPALYLVPRDRPLVATAQIAPAEGGRVHPGQPVRLVLARASTTDGARTAELTGRIASVSADVLRDAATGAGFYRVGILLDPPPPEAPRLMPGMPVEAFVATGEGSPLGYLIAPFSAYFAKAFRES